MHRTTTTTALLVTVAVSALSGCVTVQRPVTSGPPPDTVSSQRTTPRPDGSAVPRVVQAPAREALEMAGPSRRPRHGEPDARRPTPAAPPVTRRPAAPPAPVPPHHGPPRRQGGGLPGAAQPLPQAPDVCALGRQYGGWRGGSPESEICEQTYGR
ncbi:hypothetical protein ACWELO_20605 [Streptomyces sp. NPDC004596]|uniref:hypothetical protein n=1 Tax=Streptomyces sp. DSM 118148 TaxID=3448667 RepID=UPI00404007A7